MTHDPPKPRTPDNPSHDRPVTTLTRLAGLPLTERQLVIAALAANGLANPSIATYLGLRPMTIKSHMGRIFAKLKSPCRAAMTLTLLRSGALVFEGCRVVAAGVPMPSPQSFWLVDEAVPLSAARVLAAGLARKAAA